MRNVPDVSLNADPRTGYSVYFSDPVNGPDWFVIGGTSAAAPLWAAFTALVNQQRVVGGRPLLGFPNPTLYQIAAGPNYGTDFHDIADGSNNLFFNAGPGYDNATGWGSFNGANLLNELGGTAEGQAGTTLTLTSSQNPSPIGQSVTITATVLAASGSTTPTGTVQFAIDGTSSGSPVTLDGNGNVTDTEANLTQGTHTITAVYTPTGAFNSSNGSLTQTIVRRPGRQLAVRFSVGQRQQ